MHIAYNLIDPSLLRKTNGKVGEDSGSELADELRRMADLGLCYHTTALWRQRTGRAAALKRKLYEIQGVREYWILDWRLQQVEVYRRAQGELRQVATLLPEGTLTSPLLPGFACLVSGLFE